ncbi:preprotein translocase subunit SecG [Suttonella ornithocola]|uniref:Protein-export membrane protein SecG n=1 Tax=Suttonella ornithocola TaxID=279832 RepID=A0A380MPK3_9GAMM|nr:preprotein translocase subunit SecG [Suttonella ornithocola]SUO94525.1 Preprotein translocase band 1 subunit [Suttonella ornithocola]
MTLIIAQIIFIGTAIALSILILLQQSKGAGMGASFGAGASATVFGARGAGSFLYKATRALAVVFFVSALAMGYLQNKAAVGDNILQQEHLDTKKEAGVVDVPLSGADNNASASNTSIPLSKK